MTAASPAQARSSRLGLVALVTLLVLMGTLLWRFVGPPGMLLSVPDWAHVRDVLGGAQLRDDDVAAVSGGLAWLAIAYLAISVLLRVVLGTASSITGGAAWARTGLRVTEPLTLPFVRHLVDGALAGAIVLTASFQPGLAAASSGETATVSLIAPAYSRGVAGSVEPTQAPDSSPKQATLVATSYTVVSGDSLRAIAERLLGDGFRWTELWTLNQHRQMPDGRTFTHPNLIYAGRVLAMSRVLHQALADSDFADTRIVLVRETDRFLEFTLDCPLGDANALVAARHILSRQIGCSVDGTEVAPTKVRLKLSRFNRLASELFHEPEGGSLLIVPIGATDDGIYYLNLLACGSALITGGRLESGDLVSSWLATFASLYGSDEVRLAPEEASVAHIGDALSSLVGTEGHEPVASLPDLARKLESVLAEDRQGVLNTLVALAGPLAEPRDATAELEMVLGSGREHGLVTLATTEAPVDIETCRLWGAQISFDDQPGREARGLTLSLPRHPQLELEPVIIRRQTASRPPVRHPEPGPVPAPAENGHSNGNGHQHEPPFELPELPPLRSVPTSDQVVDEPEAELPPDGDDDSPEPAAPANTSALSRQSALPMTDEGEEAVAASAGPLFKVRCFGSFRVETAEGEVSGWTIQKARELLAFLLAHGGAPVLRESVAEALCPKATSTR